MLITVVYHRAGPLDDPIMLPWNHQIEMETGAQLCPTILSSSSTPTSTHIQEIFNRKSIDSFSDLDGYYDHGEPEPSSSSRSQIVTGACVLPITREAVICATLMLITFSSSCRTRG